MFRRLLDWTSSAPKFADLSQDWLANHAIRFAPGWQKDCRGLLKDQLAELGPVRADRITRRQIATTFARIKSTSIANQAHTVTSSVFSWAIATGRLDCAHPVRGLKKRQLPARERFLSEDEIRQVWNASYDLGDFGRIVRLLLLTGQRRDEIGQLEWVEVNVERREVALPAARCKNKRSHIVPLSPLAIEQLPARRNGRDHVFGRRRASGFSGWSKGKQQLNALLPRLPAWTLHDLRRTFVTQSAELGIAEPHIIEAVVNHISGHRAGVAGVYNRATYSAAKRVALERWADEVLRIVGATDQRPGGCPQVALVTPRPSIR
jgi:integrase